MTTGDWIVITIFIVALLCSISLFFWLRQLIRSDQSGPTRGVAARKATAPATRPQDTPVLTDINTQDFPLAVGMAYATSDNLAGRPVYADARCALRPEAAACLLRAAQAARHAGLTLKVLDAYRPASAQAIFWEICPDARYIADPAQGSNHTRGVAVDVTLLDGDGQPLDMGTGFDDMREQSHHNRDDLSPAAQRNRLLLLGIMLHAGFTSIATEWWHYELPDAKAWALIHDWPAPAPASAVSPSDAATAHTPTTMTTGQG